MTSHGKTRLGNKVRELYAEDRETFEEVAGEVDQAVWGAPASPTEVTIQVHTDDHEIQAIEVMMHALYGMLNDDATRLRVLRYATDRLEER